MPDYADWKGKPWEVKTVDKADFPDLDAGDTLTFEGDGKAGTGSVSKHSKLLATTKSSWATNGKHDPTSDTVAILYRSNSFTITRKPGTTPVTLECRKNGLVSGASWTAEAGGGGGGGGKPPQPPKPPKDR